MDKKVTGIVAYLTIIGWLIAFVAGDREGAKFHLNQGLVLAICSILASVVSSIPIIGFLGWLINVAVLVLSIMGIISAVNGEEKPLPLIGSIQLIK